MKKAPYLGVMVIAAFASIISGVQIDSAHADANNLNTLWLVLTIVFGVTALGSLYLATKTPKV